MISVGIGWRHPHYRELLQLRPAVDFIEVHSENFFAAGGAALDLLQQARALYPVSLHGVGLSLGSAVGIDAWHLQQLAQLVQRIEPVRVSDHASFARGQLVTPATTQVIHASDLLPIPFNVEALNVLCVNVQRVQDQLQRPIAVENLSAYIDCGRSDRSEPEFLNALAQRTGCGLLIDVNNIYVNALNAQRMQPERDPLEACRAWLSAIAPPAVVEIHLAGHCCLSDIVIDDHGSRVGDAVWTLYQHALERFGAVPTLIEWDTDLPSFSVLLSEAAHARELAQEVLEVAA